MKKKPIQTVQDLRTRAELLLDAIEEGELIAWPAPEVKRLLHELLVHQTELEMQNEELRSAQQQLKLTEQLQQAQKMEALGIAHDINNMLVVILGHAELSSSRSNDPKLIASSMQSIIQASEHSAELIRHLLTLSSNRR